MRRENRKGPGLFGNRVLYQVDRHRNTEHVIHTLDLLQPITHVNISVKNAFFEKFIRLYTNHQQVAVIPKLPAEVLISDVFGLSVGMLLLKS